MDDYVINFNNLPAFTDRLWGRGFNGQQWKYEQYNTVRYGKSIISFKASEKA